MWNYNGAKRWFRRTRSLHKLDPKPRTSRLAVQLTNNRIQGLGFKKSLSLTSGFRV